MNYTLALQKALVRSDLSSFIQMTFRTVSPDVPYRHNWHVDALAHHLTQCLEGKIKRLVITIPPRHLKTISASIAFPAFALGHDPSNRIVCVSYSQELANRYSLDTRRVMSSEWYQAIFPAAKIKPEKITQNEIMTYRRGYRYAASVGGTLTGRGGNIIIIDDPHKPEEIYSATRRDADWSWFRTTLLSRLDSKADDLIILIQQRLHEEDLAGRLLALGDYVHLNLPAIAEERQTVAIDDGATITRQGGEVLHPGRESKDLLEKLRREMGSYVFAAQYQQKPAPAGGGIIQRKWIRYFAEAPTPTKGDVIVQSWDTAYRAGELNDYSVCSTWLVRNREYYLIGLRREKLEFPALKPAVLFERDKWSAQTVLIEDSNAGSMLLAELKYDKKIEPLGIVPHLDKATRLMAVSPEFENGCVRFPENAPWLAALVHELLTFPNARHDDQVDSIAQFLTWIGERNRKPKLEWDLS